ncbi:MAG: hypothetical protein V1766_00685 [Pseudomonadota bacterium]
MIGEEGGYAEVTCLPKTGLVNSTILLDEGANPNMKKQSWVHITAIIMVGVCLYSIINQLGALLYAGGLSMTYARSFVSNFILISIGLYVCGIFAGIGLYCYKAWSRWLAMGIAAIFIFRSLPGLLITFVGNHPSTKITIESVTFTLFAIWCLYYLNRSAVEEKFKNTKADAESESDSIKTEDNIFKRPGGVKITAILLIIICGFQIVSLLLIMTKVASNVAPGPGAVISSIIIFGSIIPLLGLASGIGLLGMKIWARKFTIIFSITSIAVIGPVIAVSYTLDSRHYGLDLFFLVAYSLSLPVWSLYYFTRQHIKVLFAPK